MDAQPGSASVTQDAAPARQVIMPVPGSLLDQLMDAERAATAAAAEAAERLKSLRDRIKAEITQVHPGVRAFDIAGSQHRPGMHLTWEETVRLDAKRLKREQPRVYVEYAEFGGRWALHRSSPCS